MSRLRRQDSQYFRTTDGEIVPRARSQPQKGRPEKESVPEASKKETLDVQRDMVMIFSLKKAGLNLPFSMWKKNLTSAF